MKNRFTEFYENGNLRKTGFRNELGNIDGFVILYNEDGTEKEKLKYNNGMRLGNVLENMNDDEFSRILSEETDLVVTDELADEMPTETIILTKQEASKLLNGSKYYE
ncbi:hypothetical protein [Fusobacterium sp. PH5-44]|uniref:hypothetical protein n=1 Tax=unclassified Fusobacterium TaxID=2648384 RepID=UPI003D1E629C